MYTPELFQLTTRLLKLNPEYFSIWNVRRRLLISGPLSGSSAWILSLDGVVHFFQFRHYYTVVRNLVNIIPLGRDPFIPRVPDTREGWTEWYNS